VENFDERLLLLGRPQIHRWYQLLTNTTVRCGIPRRREDQRGPTTTAAPWLPLRSEEEIALIGAESSSLRNMEGAGRDVLAAGDAAIAPAVYDRPGPGRAARL